MLKIPPLELDQLYWGSWLSGKAKLVAQWPVVGGDDQLGKIRRFLH